MTENEWLTCSKATQPVMDWLRRRGSDRQFYLVSSAVLRMVWDQLDNQFRDLIVLVEKYADGECTDDELSRHQRRAEEDAFTQLAALSPASRSRRSPDRKRQAAARAAAHAAFPRNGWISACNAVSESVEAGKRAAMWPQICAILRDVFGNPFRPIILEPQWRTSTVRQLAEGIYAERAFDRLQVMADALEEAGCTDASILEHCRGPGPHVRGCFVLDLLLGKE